MIRPILEVIGGPNGAGKSTFANILFKDRSEFQFLNADLIAKGLRGASPRGADIQSGKILLMSLDEAIDMQKPCGFESTLAGRVWVNYFQRAREHNFIIRLNYITLESVELCLKRIRDRVALGGHDIPEEVVRRRFVLSRKMFESVYSKLCDEWFLFDNSGVEARMVADYSAHGLQVYDRAFHEGFVRDA